MMQFILHFSEPSIGFKADSDRRDLLLCPVEPVLILDRLPTHDFLLFSSLLLRRGVVLGSFFCKSKEFVAKGAGGLLFAPELELELDFNKLSIENIPVELGADDSMMSRLEELRN